MSSISALNTKSHLYEVAFKLYTRLPTFNSEKTCSQQQVLLVILTDQNTVNNSLYYINIGRLHLIEIILPIDLLSFPF